jgi:hypothetical protein
VGAVYDYILSKQRGIPAELEHIKPNALVEFDTSSILMTAVCQNNKTMVDALIKNGHDVNFKVPLNGQTALMRAVQVGNKEMVLHLLKHGADPTIRSNDGRYALQFFNIRLGDHRYRDALATQMVKAINSGKLNEDLKKNYLLALKAYIHAAGSKYFTRSATPDVTIKPPSATSDPYLTLLKHYYNIKRSATNQSLSAPVDKVSQRRVSAQETNQQIPRPLPTLPALATPSAHTSNIAAPNMKALPKLLTFVPRLKQRRPSRALVPQAAGNNNGNER